MRILKFYLCYVKSNTYVNVPLREAFMFFFFLSLFKYILLVFEAHGDSPYGLRFRIT